MAAYKTIVLEFLKEQRPALHEQLRANRLLLQAVNDYATALRTAHLAWLEELTLANPHHDPAQLSSEAMELAMQDLQEALPSVSPADEEEPRSPGEAMSHTHQDNLPPA